MIVSQLFRRAIALSSALAALLITVGCACEGQMKAFDIVVNLDPSVQNQSVLVDISAVSSASEARWNAKDDRQYWSSNDPEQFRQGQIDRGLVYRMRFVGGSGQTSATLERGDPIWPVWKEQDAITLYVLAELETQPYRQTMTLDCACWDDETRQLVFTIARSGIFPQQAPDCP